MATKAKDASPKNEKKSIPITSSNPHPFNKQGSSKSTTSRLGSNKQKLLATSPVKHTTNPLKPTLGSKPETTLKYIKKSPSGHHEDTSSNQNPTLLTRRSFDKAPLTSRVRATPPKSSLLSSNKPISNITTKPGASKPFKPAQKSQPPGSSLRALKRNSSASRKNGTSSAPVSLSTSPTNTDKTTQSLDIHTTVETLAHDEAEEVLEPHNEHLVVVDSPMCNAEGEKLGPCEVPVGEEEEVVHEDILVEEPQSELIDHPEEGSPNEGDHNKEEEGNGIDGLNNVVSEQVDIEENKQEEMDNVDDKEVESSREGIEANEDTKEIEGGVVSAQKRAVGQGKKEHPTAYNDVIEETKNKLLEERKNRVKALVGAFETVIDYESGSK